MDCVEKFSVGSCELQGLIMDLMKAKKEKTGPELQQAITEMVSKSARLFLLLKSESRKACLAMDKCRKEVDAVKGTVELAQLRLQNITYERNHIARAAQLCQAFSTKNLDKIEEEDGEPLLKDINTPITAEQHRENLAVLANELALRQRAETDLAALKKKASVTESTMSSKRTFMEGLPAHLNAFALASEPLQKYLLPSESKSKSLLATARKLPRPLYVLLLQLQGYVSFFSSFKVCEQDDLAVQVVPAKNYRPSSPAMDPPASVDTQPPSSSQTSPSPISSSTKRPSNQDDEDGGSLKRNRHHGGKDTESNVSGQKSIGSPTFVSIRTKAASEKRSSRSKTQKPESSTISGESDEAILLTVKVYVAEVAEVVEVNITFHYVPAIQAITVVVENNPDLLATLIPGDIGTSCPTPASRQLMLAGAKLPGYGRMYQWAQRLAGLMDCQGGTESEEDTSDLEASTRSILERVCYRIRARTLLNLQLQKLQNKPHPIPVHPSCKLLFAPDSKTGAKLMSWQELPKPEMEAFPPTDFTPPCQQGESPKRPEWQRYGCRFFSASFGRTRGEKKVHLSVLCEVSPEYPIRAPRFLLQSRAEPASGSAPRPYDNNLKAIEMEVNAFYDEVISSDPDSLDWVLTHQLRKLQACFDTLGESGSSGPVNQRTQR